MNLQIKNKKIEVIEYNKFKDRIKSLKFVLEPIDNGIKIPNTRIINTYFFCQRIDICVTDKEDKIILLYENVKSEKLKFLWKKYNLYYLPLDTAKELKLGEKIKEKK